MSTFAQNLRWEAVPDEYGDASYLEQEGFEDRLAEYRSGAFGFLGVQAVCELYIPQGTCYIVNELRSPGLWGIETDSDDSYLAEVGAEEVTQLRDMLAELHTRVVI